MAKKSEVTRISLEYPKLLAPGDAIVFMHAGEREGIKTYEGSTVKKDDGTPKKKLVLYGISISGGFVKDPDDEDEMIALQPGERMSYTIDGKAWWELGTASKKLAAYGPVNKGDRGGSGACVIQVRFASYSRALKSGKGGDHSKLFTKFMATDPAGAVIDAVTGRLVLSTDAAYKTFKSWADGRFDASFGKDLEFRVRRPKPEEAEIEAAADEFDDDRKGLADANGGSDHDDADGADGGDAPEDENPF